MPTPATSQTGTFVHRSHVPEIVIQSSKMTPASLRRALERLLSFPNRWYGRWKFLAVMHKNLALGSLSLFLGAKGEL